VSKGKKKKLHPETTQKKNFSIYSMRELSPKKRMFSRKKKKGADSKQGGMKKGRKRVWVKKREKNETGCSRRAPGL